MDREQSIQRLQARLAKSKNPKQLISNYGFQKFITVSGDAQLEIDENKLTGESAFCNHSAHQTNISRIGY